MPAGYTLHLPRRDEYRMFRPPPHCRGDKAYLAMAKGVLYGEGRNRPLRRRQGLEEERGAVFHEIARILHKGGHLPMAETLLYGEGRSQVLCMLDRVPGFVKGLLDEQAATLFRVG